MASVSARWDSLHHLERSQSSCESCGAVSRPRIRDWRLEVVKEAVVGRTAGEEQNSGQTRPPDWPSLLLPLPHHDTIRDESENWVREEKRVFTKGIDGCYSTMQMRMNKCLKQKLAGLHQSVRKCQTPKGWGPSRGHRSHSECAPGGQSSKISNAALDYNPKTLT